MDENHLLRDYWFILGTLFVVCTMISVGLLSDAQRVRSVAGVWNSGLVAAAANAVTPEQQAYCEYGQKKTGNALQDNCMPGCTYQVSVGSGKPVIKVTGAPSPVPPKLQKCLDSGMSREKCGYDVHWDATGQCTPAMNCLPQGRVYYVEAPAGLNPGGSSAPSTYGPIYCKGDNKTTFPPSIMTAINQSKYGSTIGAQLSGYSGSSHSPTASLGTVKTAPQSLAQTISKQTNTNGILNQNYCCTADGRAWDVTWYNPKPSPGDPLSGLGAPVSTNVSPTEQTAYNTMEATRFQNFARETDPYSILETNRFKNFATDPYDTPAGVINPEASAETIPLDSGTESASAPSPSKTPAIAAPAVANVPTTTPCPSWARADATCYTFDGVQSGIDKSVMQRLGNPSYSCLPSSDGKLLCQTWTPATAPPPSLPKCKTITTWGFLGYLSSVFGACTL